MNNRRRLGASVIGLMVLLLMTACQRESNQNRPVTTTATPGGTTTAPPAQETEKRDRALVRVIHAIPGGGSVDVMSDGQVIFSNVAYKTTSPYKEVPAGQQTFRIRAAGREMGQPLAENREMMGGGDHYTIIAEPSTGMTGATTDGTRMDHADRNRPTTDQTSGAAARADLRVVSDDLAPPSSGKAKVRVIHASPDVGEVDVYVRGRNDALFSGVNATSETRYTEVDPMTATLEVRPQGQKTALLTIPNLTLDAGKIYTVVITGHKGKLEALRVEDQFQGQPQGQMQPRTQGQSPSGRTTSRPASDQRRR
jgi:hypothetical protein